MSLPTRKIGTTSVPIPGYGLMGFSALYGTTASEEEFLPVFKAAYDAGCRMWDTADVYGRKGLHENERLLAKAMKELNIPRNDIFLCTKFGALAGFVGVRGDPEYVHSACAASLEALGTDHIDLYYQHRVDPKTPIEDTVRAMKELQDQGKIKYIGLSECSADTLRRASKVAKIDAVQIEYSLFSTDVETNGILDACKELGVTFVAYSPLGRGFLAGRFKSRGDLSAGDWRLTVPRFSEENFPTNLDLVNKVSSIAHAKGCTPAQLALAWLLAQGPNVFVIPGTTRKEALLDNIGCAKVHLTDGELAEIRKILDQFPVAGTRYNASVMHTVNM
ncbi:Aldo/keto reductase [Dacryopinax primogenitus]|uniref:Aldo/keto reductase n=1 Tax=Dacryopinax primogenitus (strain DJM 731) TaxID=1858805 RepID=M5FS65_DACPD|nr:Aldo/keto reductase [Dacryopinax primogenitus]EJT98638.1 Aldo/keto reductase [Dacryopinax primogenitus]